MPISGAIAYESAPSAADATQSEGDDSCEDEFPEIELPEIPVAKRMAFRFKRPVPMEF